MSIRYSLYFVYVKVNFSSKGRQFGVAEKTSKSMISIDVCCQFPVYQVLEPIEGTL